jgi:hypothetical protein
VEEKELEKQRLKWLARPQSSRLLMPILPIDKVLRASLEGYAAWIVTVQQKVTVGGSNAQKIGSALLIKHMILMGLLQSCGLCTRHCVMDPIIWTKV